MADKGFKTLDEQIAILTSRGLQIPDVDEAKEFLRKNNYYRVSGYSLTLRSHDVFSKTATFQNIVDIYECDHELRYILLKYIERIEVAVKSIYAYEFTKEYGPTGYLDAGNFTDPTKHQEILEKAEKQKKSRLRHEAYLKHFVEELHQDVPLWAYVDLFTISDISFLYSISDHSLKTVVAESMGITKQGARLLGQFMHSMTIIRNLCAHGSRLYNRLFEQKPNLNKTQLAVLRENKDGSKDNAHLFGFLLIMKRLLSEEDFKECKKDLIRLAQSYPFVHMKYYGFPGNWQDVL